MRSSVACVISFLCFVVAISASTGTQWINLLEGEAVFTDVAFNCKYNTVLTATNLNFPYFAAAYDPRNGTHKWGTAARQIDSVRVQTAAHRYTSSRSVDGSKVEVLVAEVDTQVSDTFSLFGYTITGQRVWSKSIPVSPTNGYLDPENPEFVIISDDASLAAFIQINGDTSQTVWQVLDAASGDELWNVSSNALEAALLEFSSDGSLLFWQLDFSIYSFDARTGKKHADPLPMPNSDELNAFGFASYKNGKDEYMVSATDVLQLHKFDSKKAVYNLVWEVDYKAKGIYFGAVAITEVDGTIYVASAGTPSSFNSLLVEMRTIASSNPTWTYTTKPSDGALENSVSSLVLDPSGYMALSSWGDDIHTPQVMLFHVKSNETVWSAGTPGSMFSVDLCFDGKLAWVAAAGKHVHANILGAGGNFLTWSVSP